MDGFFGFANLMEDMKLNVFKVGLGFHLYLHS